MMPTAVSLFSGCGGSDVGVTAAGFRVVLANDVMKYARDFYLANHEETDYVLGDVRGISSFPMCDLLIGCYPCQGFSQAGVRDPSRSVNYLYREFDRALRQIKPKAFIVENVSGMKRSDNLSLYNNQITRFRMAGYRVKAGILNAVDFGVAQERRRLFFVGIRSDFDVEFDLPAATHSREGSGGKPKHLTMRDAIGDLPNWPDGEFDTQPFHWYYLSRNRYRGWSEQSRTVVAASRHSALHPLSPKLWREHTDAWHFSSDEPARRLSYRENARLQGFQRNICFPEGSLGEKYRVIGNAVPPPLFEAVARSLPSIW